MPVIDAGNKERHRRKGLTCPDAFVVAGTKPESADSAEWVRETNIACHRVRFSVMQQSSKIVASQKTPRDDMQYASLGTLSAEPANATWCLQQQTSQGKRDLLVCAAVAASSIAGIYRNKGVNRPTHHCELRIMAGRWYLSRSLRSARRRGNLDPISKGERLMQKTLLRQREVRMMSSKGMDLLST